jgi:hypothetical protein
MGTYGLEGVMRAWELEKLTTEQAVGQVLQLIAEIEERLRDLEHKYGNMSRTTNAQVCEPKDEKKEDEKEDEKED